MCIGNTKHVNAITVIPNHGQSVAVTYTSYHIYFPTLLLLITLQSCSPTLLLAYVPWVNASSFILQQEIFLFDSMDDGEAQTFIYVFTSFDRSHFGSSIQRPVFLSSASQMPKKKQPVPVSDGNDEDFLKSLNVAKR